MKLGELKRMLERVQAQDDYDVVVHAWTDDGEYGGTIGAVTADHDLATNPDPPCITLHCGPEESSSAPDGPRHVDDFIDAHDSDPYAALVLNYFRLPAIDRVRYAPWMKRFALFCTYQGNRYRVTGASRLGDVWLAKDREREAGYDLRVNVDDCSEWSRSLDFELGSPP